MNDLLQSRLQTLAQDELTLQAIKAHFQYWIEKAKPNVASNLDNSIIGQEYRAYMEAQKILTTVMDEIEAYKYLKVKSNKINKGK